jgi:hypothetical protein
VLLRLASADFVAGGSRNLVHRLMSLLRCITTSVVDIKPASIITNQLIKHTHAAPGSGSYQHCSNTSRARPALPTSYLLVLPAHPTYFCLLLALPAPGLGNSSRARVLASRQGPNRPQSLLAKAAYANCELPTGANSGVNLMPRWHRACRRCSCRRLVIRPWGGHDRFCTRLGAKKEEG